MAAIQSQQVWVFLTLAQKRSSSGRFQFRYMQARSQNRLRLSGVLKGF
jgi:hypothetical protein